MSGLTQSPVTLRAVWLGLAIGSVVCWWLTRTPSPARTEERRTAAAATSDVPRAPRPRTPDAAENADSAEALTETKTAETPKPARRVVFHVVGDDDGKPIGGARISDMFADAPTVVTTDASGDAAFDASEVESDFTYFRVEAAGRVRDDVRVDFRVSVEVTRTVYLDPGYAVDGVVLDVEGSPIAGARCAAIGPGSCMGPGDTVGETRTDADGRFRLDGLPLRKPLSLHATSPRHRWQAVYRRAHDASFLEFRLEPAGLIRGVVRGHDGKPLSRAEVTARAAGEVVLAAKSGDDGRYELGGLALGAAWTFSVEHSAGVDPGGAEPFVPTKDRAEATRDFDLLACKRIEVVLVGPDDVRREGTIGAKWPGGSSWFNRCVVPGRTSISVGRSGTCSISVEAPGLRVAHADVEIGDAETQTVEIRLDRGGTFVGTVVDDVGAPIAGAGVSLWCKAENRFPKTTSAADGSFRLEGLDDGVHDVSAEAAGHGKVKEEDVESPRKDPLRLVLPRDGAVAGRLRLPDGAPRPATRTIRCQDADYHSVSEEEPWTSEEFVRPLAPGKWETTIDVAGYVRVVREVVVQAGARTELGAIDLAPEAPFVGRVIDAQGRPVARADIWVEGMPGRFDWRTADSDADGRFSVPGLAPGSYRLRVTHDDFVESARPLVLVKDAAPLVVTMSRGAFLRVRLVGPEPKKLREFDVRLERGPAGDDAECESLEQETVGRYSSRVPSGAYRLKVTQSEDDATVAVREIELREGEDKAIDVELPK